MIAVLDFGMGNIHSLLKAVSLHTDDFIFTSDPNKVKSADKIILPGDGHFDKAMENLNELGFVSIIKEHVAAKKYLFGICIGYQVLFEDSDETNKIGSTISGLGLIRGKIRKFEGKPNLKVPHMGWNKLFDIKPKNTKLLKGIPNESFMYFIHSYRPVGVDRLDITANCHYYGESFPAVVEKETIFGTQFHPEKSDKIGLGILKNFIEL
ncbi:imidazole glycerol phosphate synthase subunit hisH [Leptospira ellinghausenii]|uniref:Imidazole glycerol phosphate synthase subunit HisH n=1 Tax=Leptospira ellinghausenii TaxID=1917822 RepID=A0A2P2DDA8_9LEPT|nr:imidazole glycerol phosphate synthase subunit HisH [Leptospira ellinghausenii]GBF42599.1 imidazole glycerol phosphate synthase subunit hisH [Leptospira ellinghausenii]